MPEDKDQILNDIFKKVNEVSSTVESLLSIQKKESKEQSETVALQEEEQRENSLLVENEKQNRIKTTKLLEEIRDKQFFSESGGGGLAGLLELSKFVGPLLVAAIPFILKSLLVAGTSAVFYKIGDMIYENAIGPWLDPLLNKFDNDRRQSMNLDVFGSKQQTLDTGEALFTEKETGKIVTESQAKGVAESKGLSLQQAEEQGVVNKRTVMVSPETGRQQLPGKEFAPQITSQELEQLNESKQIEKRKQTQEPKSVEDLNVQEAQNIIRPLERSKEMIDQVVPNMSKEYTSVDSARKDMNQINGAIESLVQYVNRREIEEKEYKQKNGEDSMYYPMSIVRKWLSNNPLIRELSFATGAMGSDIALMENVKPLYAVEFDTFFGFGETNKIAFEQQIDGRDYTVEELQKYAKERWGSLQFGGNSTLEDYAQIVKQFKQTPKYKNEGIIEGSRFGKKIIAGENYTSEAVVSTKSNTVTESIGNNLYNIMKEKAVEDVYPTQRESSLLSQSSDPTKPNTVTESIGNNLYKVIKQNAANDITSTQRQTMILSAALTNTAQQYNDAYKIAPMNQGGQTVINNFMGNNVGNRTPSPNSHYNISGLDTNNTETVLQKVYMDAYKAALL